MESKMEKALAKGEFYVCYQPKYSTQDRKVVGAEALVRWKMNGESIVPPSDFLLNENAPFFEKTMDYKGENHYEETNSVGIGCAQSIAETFEAVLNALDSRAAVKIGNYNRFIESYNNPVEISRNSGAKVYIFALAHCGTLGSLNRNRGKEKTQDILEIQRNDWRRIIPYL